MRNQRIIITERRGKPVVRGNGNRYALDALEREAERREKAADIPYIGMEDCQREVERVLYFRCSDI